MLRLLGPRLLVLALCGLAVGQNPPPGGHFRSASVGWALVGGNEVEFEVQSEWRRSFGGHYKDGAPANSSIFVGDNITIGGSQSPKLTFGDGAIAYLVVEVTAVSANDDWFRGVSHIRHTYTTPNLPGGEPWEAVFSGCCKLPSLVNDGNLGFRLVTTLDLTQADGIVALRTPGLITVPQATSGQEQPCKIPGSFFGLSGACFKLHATTLPCADHESNIGTGLDFSFGSPPNTVADAVLEIPVQRQPVTLGGAQGLDIAPDGTVRLLCNGGQCVGPGVYSARAQITDGRVVHVRIDNAGTGCTVGVLRARCGVTPCQAGGGAEFLGRWEVDGSGVASRVVIDNPGSGFYSPPEIYIDQGICPGLAVSPVSIITQAYFMVRVIPDHRCYVGTVGTVRDCDPLIAGIQYTGSPAAFISPPHFPGVGNGFDPVTMRIVPPVPPFSPYNYNGGTDLQAAAGHLVAYAGSELSMSFNASVNWCLGRYNKAFFAPDLQLDPRCVVPEAAVRIQFGPMPPTAHFYSFQRDAIAELMVTYDNPFEAHRPGHDWAVGREQRDYTGMPNAEQATRLGFTRIEKNLNSGVGGASVYLWFRRFDRLREGEEAITSIQVSVDAADEERLAADGYHKVEGNLNEQAGGNEVHVWFKKSSGSYAYRPDAPQADGVDVGITEIAFTNASDAHQFDEKAAVDVNPYVNGTQVAAGARWERVPRDLNAGLHNTINLYYRKGVANPFVQEVQWTPCHCDVGRTYMCVSAQSSLPDGLGFAQSTGNTSCVAVDVLPDIVPEFKSPAQEQSFDMFMGRESRLPIIAAVHNPHRVVHWEADGLPHGAALAPSTSLEADFDAACVAAPCSHRVMDLRWTPAFNQGGLGARVCVHARAEDSGCAVPGASVAEVCVRLVVRKCVYALQEDQQLHEIASLYGTDWLNLYSLNPTIRTPDRLLSLGQLVNIGHMYSVVPGDTLYKISTRFGSSVDHLLVVNADIESGDQIHAGHEICIVPNSCVADINA